MGGHVVTGVLKGAAVAVSGAAGFVAFGLVVGYLASAPALQLGVAGAMGLVAAATVHRVLATSEIPQLLSRASRGERGG